MAVILDVLPDLFERAPNCPDPTAESAYRRAARSFCIQSRWLRRALDPFDCEADVPFIELVTGTGDPLLEIIGVRVVTARLVTNALQAWPVNPTDGTEWASYTSQGPPKGYQYVPEAAINLYPTPDQAYTLVVTAQVQPRSDAVELPDDLETRWHETLIAGALSYVLALRGQPWADPGEARAQAVKFQAGVNNARADEARAYTQGSRVSRIRRIF